MSSGVSANGSSARSTSNPSSEAEEELSGDDIQQLTHFQELVVEHIQVVLFSGSACDLANRKKENSLLKLLIKGLQKKLHVPSRLTDLYLDSLKKHGEPAEGLQSFRHLRHRRKAQGRGGSFELNISASHENGESSHAKLTARSSSSSKSSPMSFSISASSCEDPASKHNSDIEDYGKPSSSPTSISRRPPMFTETKNVSTQTVDTSAMPPKPPAGTRQQSVFPVVQYITRGPPIILSSRKLAVPELQETPSETVSHLVYDMLLRLNPRGRGCCYLHIGLLVLHHVISKMMMQSCNQQLMPHRAWQCATCLLLEEDLDVDDNPLTTCFLCCSERDGLQESAPNPEATGAEVGPAAPVTS